MLTEPTMLVDRETEASDVDGDGSVLSSASKALALLEAIAGARGGIVGLSDIASALGMPKSTIHRLLKTLEDHGFIGRAGSKYRIGNRFYELSEAARWSEYGELRELATQPMSFLYERTGATVHLAVRQDSVVLYLEKITGAAGYRIPTRVGARLPATCTALGKAILAFSDVADTADVLRQPLQRATKYSISTPRQLADQLLETRRTGFAVALEEARLGVGCVAAPVLVDGKAVAAISVCLPSARERHQDYGRLVKEAAAGVSRLLTAA